MFLDVHMQSKLSIGQTFNLYVYSSCDLLKHTLPRLSAFNGRLSTHYDRLKSKDVPCAYSVSARSF